MAFLNVRFPDDISYGAVGGPSYSTDVVIVNSGFEQRNQNWADARSSFDVSHAARTRTQIETLIKFFRVAKGRANTFRYKDWMDYTVATTEGYLDNAIGDGTPTYQLYKYYSNAAGSELRKITRPVSGNVAVLRNAVAVTVGAGAGNIAIDYETGVIAFVADSSSAASAITVGATTQVTLAANLGLIAGKKLYLAGFTGADAALINGIAHTINSVSGAGPYVFTLATDTAAKTITVGSGTGYKYPQASDALTWSGQFDIPARFDVDQLRGEHIANEVFGWSSIPIIEVRE